MVSLRCSQVAEVQAGLQAVRSEDVAKFQRLLSSARRIVCFGVGREGLALKAFAMRLFHIEFQVGTCVSCWKTSRLVEFGTAAP